MKRTALFHPSHGHAVEVDPAENLRPKSSNMKSIRIRVDHADTGHVHFTVFMGDKDCTRGNCGRLCMTPLEYSIFTLLLQAGSITAPNRAEVTYDMPNIEQ